MQLPQRTDDGGILEALRTEIDLLTPWYEETRRRRGRTTVGMSGATPEQIDAVAQFIAACAEDASFFEIPAAADGPTAPQWSHQMPILLRFVVEDLRAFYQEAVTSRPGTAPPSQHAMHSWIFQETALGQALIQIGRRIAAVGEPPLLLMRGFIIPEGFWEDGPSWGAQPRNVSADDAMRKTQAYLSG